MNTPVTVYSSVALLRWAPGSDAALSKTQSQFKWILKSFEEFLIEWTFFVDWGSALLANVQVQWPSPDWYIEVLENVRLKYRMNK